MFNETFLEMSYYCKTLLRTKLKFYPFGVNRGLLSIFGPITQNQKTHISFSETISQMPYCQLNFGKNKLEILPFWGAFELILIFGPTGLK